jgi:hypothetical protein
MGELTNKSSAHAFPNRCQLDGQAFHETYISGDNSKVVPTDTVKNTVWFLARTKEFSSVEEFALILARYEQSLQRSWKTMLIGSDFFSLRLHLPYFSNTSFFFFFFFFFSFRCSHFIGKYSWVEKVHATVTQVRPGMVAML